MNKRTKIVFGSILGIIILILCRFTFPLKRESVYYIPECKIYLRKEIGAWEKYGYIYFGRDSNTVWSSDDYVKLYAAVDNIILSVYNSSFNDTTYLTSGTKISEIKQTHFNFVQKKQFDATFFNPTGKIPESYRLKSGFKGIEIYDFGDDMFVFSDTLPSRKVFRIY
ncbi:hypothetical protein [uncultured Bacteroides sp.]|uniref:hypothetical protein n=1 Tax=uncultured Bacteroides sp. TaxID=162156 RepID=UPI0025EA54EE|nr:hypothetical protein [uncultured Bacteroides sp.]